MNYTPSQVDTLEENQVFVFGSNEAGRHGKGAALTAFETFGAKRGIANGIQGKSYAIPTKNTSLLPLTLNEIRPYVNEFLNYARLNTNKEFLVTEIGCGLAGNKIESIAPMFANYTDNVKLPLPFYSVLYPNKKLF